jgi:hypothetical protein
MDNDAGGDVEVADAPSSTDVVSEPLPDTSTACPDADLVSYSPPDAALGDGGGGASVGTCLGCIRQVSCSSELRACNAKCACKEAVVEFAACLARGGSATLACALSSGFETTSEGQNLGGCVYQNCLGPCGVGRGDAGDGGG